MTIITRQQQRFERLLRQEASPVPASRPKPAWLLLGAGMTIGMALGGAHRWLITPLNPAPQEARCPQRNFQLAQLPDSAMEPFMTPQQIAEFRRHLGPQRPQTPAPPSPPPASEPEPAC